MINKLFAIHIVSVCFRSFRQMKKVCKWPTQSPKKLSISLFFISRLKAWYELFYWNSQCYFMAVEIWAPSTSSQVKLFKCHFSNSKSLVALKKVAGHRISTVEKQSAILQEFTEIWSRTMQSIHSMILNRYWLPTTIKLYSNDFHRVL